MRRARSPAAARESTNGRRPETLQSRGTSRCTKIVTSAQPSASRRSRSSADGGRTLDEEDEEDGDEFAAAAASAAAGPATDARPLRSADAGTGSGCGCG